MLPALTSQARNWRDDFMIFGTFVDEIINRRPRVLEHLVLLVHKRLIDRAACVDAIWRKTVKGTACFKRGLVYCLPEYVPSRG